MRAFHLLHSFAASKINSLKLTKRLKGEIEIQEKKTIEGKGNCAQVCGAGRHQIKIWDSKKSKKISEKISENQNFEQLTLMADFRYQKEAKTTLKKSEDFLFRFGSRKGA